MRTLSPRVGVAALVGVAVVLQLARLPFRWNQITFAYAAYYREYVRIVDLEGPLAALTTFVGAHPPGYSLLFAGMMTAAVPGGLWLGISGALSVSTVASVAAATRREGPRVALIAAAVVALSPYRAAYGLEVNNYPMLVGTVGLQWWAFAVWSADPSRRSGLLWAMASAAAVWVHALGITLPIAQLGAVLLLERSRGPGALAWCSLAAALCAPLLLGVLTHSESPPINDPPGIAGAAEAALVTLPGRYGWAVATWVLVAAAIVGALRERTLLARAAALHGVSTLTVIGLLVARGAAADHQLPYYVVALPASALLIGFGARSRNVAAATTAALALHLVWAVGAGVEGRRAASGAASTHELVGTAVEAWGPGDSLLLVQFPTHGDDDKDVVDPAYAFIPKTARVYFDDPEVPTQVPADPYFGQPVRMHEGRWLYTFATFDPERFDLIHDTVRSRGERLVVVHYDRAQEPREGERLAFWARGKGRRPVVDDDAALWVFLP